jgi:hypothetical protein
MYLKKLAASTSTDDSSFKIEPMGIPRNTLMRMRSHPPKYTSTTHSLSIAKCLNIALHNLVDIARNLLNIPIPPLNLQQLPYLSSALAMLD